MLSGVNEVFLFPFLKESIFIGFFLFLFLSILYIHASFFEAAGIEWV